MFYRGMGLYFRKEDIFFLDEVLKQLIEVDNKGDRGLCAIDEPICSLLKIDKSFNDLQQIEKPFIYYMHIFKAYKVANVEYNDDDFYHFLTANKKTRSFYQNGGFKKLYNTILNEENINHQQALLVEKQIKEINRNKYLSVIAIVISLISLIVSLLKS